MDELKYSAYINDKLICFSDIYTKGGILDFPGLQIKSDASHPLDEAITKLGKRDDWKGLVYLCNSPKRTWEEFVSMYSLQEAAGGLVLNEFDELLIIFRRGKWDLPKGKIDYDEMPEQAAIREVKEECGIENLELGKPLATTFHTYSEKKKNILKKTYWFLMRSNSSESLLPQTEEDIEKVVWMNQEQIKKEVLSNTYFSIKNLLKKYLQIH